MAQKVINIKIVSDTVCPWCWVGKKNLEAAMKQVQEKYKFDIRWLAFQLSPSTPEEGLDHDEHIAKKYGRSIAEVRKMHEHLAAAGQRAGIKFSPGGRVVNTDKVVEETFRRYFDVQDNVNDVAVLSEIAETAGLDKEEARKFLESDELKQHVMEESASWSGKVDGVPFFIFNDKFALSGGQPPQAFLQAFEKAASLTPTA